MQIVSILVIAIGLSMDSLAVSMATACSYKNKTTYINLRFAFTLGFIQALSLIAGWAAGLELTKILQKYDHWIAFLLLLIIGGKMLVEGIKHKEQKIKQEINMDNFFTVTGLGIATSIDAAIVGVSLPFVGLNIWISAFIIFIITFCFSYFGLLGGEFIRKRLRNIPIEIIGGLFLIELGTKVLIEHLINGC